MCFNTDYDWYAAVNDEWEGVAAGPSRCDECGSRIHAGEWRRTVHQEEHETCLHGETFDYVCCERCHTLRRAIRVVEEADGCTGGEAEPGLGTMHDDVVNGYGWQHYADEFLRLGLTDALRLVPPPDPEDVFDGLADDRDTWSRRYAWRPGTTYPNAVCYATADDPPDWFDLGGEG